VSLQLERVVKHYRSADEDVPAVDDISLVAAPGEMVAVQGPSGSGKTTLLKLAAGLLTPEAGTVRWDGRDLAAFSEDEASEYLLRDVGFVYQSFRLMPRVSAVENASIKLLLGGVGMRAARARAIPWLERLGLGERLDHPPERLSGGERQRVAIARALAGEPRLILADEPTGNLDSARSREVVALLGSIARERGACVVLVTHDADAARVADRRLTLRDGRLLETGDRDRPSPGPDGEGGDGDPPAPAAGGVAEASGVAAV